MDISNSIDIRGCISWQYEHSPNFVKIVEGFNDLFVAISTDLWNQIISMILDIDRASGFGLDLLGAIIGFKRPILSGVSVSDDIYRPIIKAKFFILTSEYSVYDINEFLNIAFGNAVIVEDNYDMTISYTLLDSTNQFLTQLFKPSNLSLFLDIFPLPCGVYIKQDESPIAFIPFGLNNTLTEGQNLSNFNHGGFAS